MPVERVEFGVDGVWQAAEVLPAVGRYAWSRWRFDWQAEPGEYVLSCRATDANGATQPLQPPWDLAGFGNNAVQRIDVFVA